MITLSTGPDWASIVTAIGTVLVAIVAVGIAIWSERRTDRRLAGERAHSDKQLAGERALSRAQIDEERQVARDREQLSEAYAVQVVLAERSTGAPGERDASPKRLAAIVINHGRYTITGIEAQLRLTAPAIPAWCRLPGGAGGPGPMSLTPSCLMA